MITRRSTRRNHPKDSNEENIKHEPANVSKQENVENDNNLPKRIKELEDSIIELRKLWLAAKNDLESYDNNVLSEKTAPSTSTTQTVTTTTTTTTTTSTPSTKSSSKANTSTSSESEKPPIRALTRRESSRKNLENTLSTLCKEASEIKAINLFTKPAQELERENYDKYILNHKDISIINERNAIMFYPPGHKIYKAAIELRDKLVPQWEKALIERFRVRH